MTAITRFLPLVLANLALGLGLAASPPTLAVGDLSQQPPVEVRVQLGDKDNAMRFTPDRIELETGRLYKLVLDNQSPQKHYFSSDAFAGALDTRKVQSWARRVGEKGSWNKGAMQGVCMNAGMACDRQS
jgi:uncharacterized cupredoxin-like copper-binding protein